MGVQCFHNPFVSSEVEKRIARAGNAFLDFARNERGGVA